MDSIIFQYVADEYDDDDVYMPSKNVVVTHNTELRPTLPEVVDTFKDFLLTIGFTQQTVDLITVAKTPYEKLLDDEEELL